MATLQPPAEDYYVVCQRQYAYAKTRGIVQVPPIKKRFTFDQSSYPDSTCLWTDQRKLAAVARRSGYQQPAITGFSHKTLEFSDHYSSVAYNRNPRRRCIQDVAFIPSDSSSQAKKQKPRRETWTSSAKQFVTDDDCNAATTSWSSVGRCNR